MLISKSLQLLEFYKLQYRSRSTFTLLLMLRYIHCASPGQHTFISLIQLLLILFINFQLFHCFVIFSSLYKQSLIKKTYDQNVLLQRFCHVLFTLDENCALFFVIRLAHAILFAFIFEILLRIYIYFLHYLRALF